jgi:type I restriction enzyme, S subunit
VTEMASVASTVRSLGDIVQPRRERVKPADHPQLPYVGMEHVEAHQSRLITTVPASQMRSLAGRFYSGDVLYGRLRPYLNKVWRADRDGLCSTEFIVLPPSDAIDPDYLRYRLLAQDFVSFALHLNAGDRPRVDFDQLADFPVALPSSPDQQRRIVAEIEQQFTRLDAGVAALRRLQANLKRYRATVLKAACEGRLVPTEAELARREGRAGDFESGEKLIARTLSERGRNWQGRGSYRTPVGPDKSILGSLPEGWAWATFEQIAERVTVGFVGSMKHEYVPSGVSRSCEVRTSGRTALTQMGCSTLAPNFTESFRSPPCIPEIWQSYAPAQSG